MDWSDRIGRRVKLRDLHILMAIADCGSMAKAAAKLGISNPVISKTVADLEHVLGVRLLDRGSQGVELTASGRILLQCGVNVFDEMQQGIRSIEHLSDPNSGNVRVGCTEATLSSVVPVITEKFARQYPGIRLDVVLTNPGEHQVLELRGRKVDLLISRSTALLAEDDLQSEVLFDEPFVAVAGGQSRWARKRQMALADILGESWVMPPYHSIPGGLIAEIFRNHGLQPPQPHVATLSTHLTIKLIASGHFVGFLPNSIAALHTGRTALKILPVKLSGSPISVDVVVVRNRTLSRAVELFIACARDVTKSLVRSPRKP